MCMENFGRTGKGSQMRESLSRIAVLALALPSIGAEIAIPDTATLVERTAAVELSFALERITGEAFDVVSATPLRRFREGADPDR